MRQEWWTAAERWETTWITYQLENQVWSSCRPYIQHLPPKWPFHWRIYTPLGLARFLWRIDWSPIAAWRLPVPNDWIRRCCSSKETNVTWHCAETNHNDGKWSQHSQCGILYDTLLSSGWGAIPLHVCSSWQEMDIGSNSMVGGMGARRTCTFFILHF